MTSTKKCVLIYNPVSSGFKAKLLTEACEELNKYGYVVQVKPSEYGGHIEEIVKEYNSTSDLIITIGGDGTVGEATRGFYSVEQHALYSHISTGTTNDMANNLRLLKNHPMKALGMILEGKEQTIDILTVNDIPFAYISAFGFLSNVPYDTNTVEKRTFGHAAYIRTAMPLLFKKPRTLWVTVTDENGNEKECRYIFTAVTNAKAAAGVTLHPNADTNDGMFEVIAIKDNINSKMIMRIFKDYLLNNVDLKNYSDCIDVIKTNYIKFDFNGSPPFIPLDNDGDKAPYSFSYFNDTLEYKVSKKLKLLIPKE